MVAVVVSRRRALALLAAPVAVAAGGTAVASWWSAAPAKKVRAEFSTSLAGRSPAQRHNARWAARRLDGAVIAQNGSFSYNHRLGPWTRNEGVLRAPVSYGGILVPSWGGSVCQVSTTLYCAALLAGLEVIERHPHEVAPSYIPAGMDAAVAFNLADLRLHNPFNYPVTIECRIEADRLLCRLVAESDSSPTVHYQLVRELVSSQLPPRLERGHPQPGRAGVRVRLWRVRPDSAERFLCNETEYAALPRSG